MFSFFGVFNQELGPDQHWPKILDPQHCVETWPYLTLVNKSSALPLTHAQMSFPPPPSPPRVLEAANTEVCVILVYLDRVGRFFSQIAAD